MFLATAGVPLACPTSSGAEAASPPDSARIVWVRRELEHFDDVRVVTGGVKVLGRGPLVSSDGLWLSSDTGRGSIAPSWTPPQQRLVPWAEIESIQARKGEGRSAVALGALAGLAIGLAIEMADVLDHPLAPKQSGMPMLVGIAGGAAIGSLVDRPGPWQPVYP
ncbi:MAG TPA: hypothetical protein VL332_01640 [Candidatus Saccharimonadaceae bacterium]|nr:hypothetical protein [Candidatus Saccharimonadaceae bacterium]